MSDLPNTFSNEFLHALHLLHQRAKSLRENAEALPRQLAAKRAALQRKEAAVDAARKALNDEKVAQGRKELNLKTQTARADELRVKLNTVRKNDEYNAVIRELQRERANITASEEAVLESMANVETLAAALAAAEVEANEARALVERSAAEIQGKIDELRAKIAEVEAELANAETVIPPEDRELYRRAIKRGAEAMAPVEDGVCMGCYVALPPQSRNELAEGLALMACKSCGRLLYIPAPVVNVLKRANETG